MKGRRYRFALQRTVASLSSALVALAGLAAIARPLVHHYAAWLFDRRLLPPETESMSRLASVALGLILLYVAFGLGARRLGAWRMASAALVLAAVLAGISGLYVAFAGYFTIAMALIASKPYFTLKGGERSWRPAILLGVTALAVAMTYAVFGFYLMDRRDFGQDYTFIGAVFQALKAYFGLTDGLTPRTWHARLFLDSLTVIGLGTVAAVAVAVLRPVRYRLVQQTHERSALAEAARRYSANPEDFFKLWPHDKSYLLLPDKHGGTAYAVASGVGLAVGDPIAPSDSIPAAITAFRDLCWEHGWQPAFMYATGRNRAAYEAVGFERLKIGEDAVVDLKQFMDETSRNKHFRNIRNRFDKAGYRFERHIPPHTATVIEETGRVSRAWLMQPGRREWGFAAGSYSPSYMQACSLAAVYDGDGKMVAFANELPVFKGETVTVDLMRFNPAAPSNVMDYLFLSLFKALAESGRHRFSLGLAPLSGLGGPKSDPVERILSLVYASRQPFLAFKGLRQFKEKFKPVWEERYVFYMPPARNLAVVAVALTRLMGRPDATLATEQARDDNMAIDSLERE